MRPRQWRRDWRCLSTRRGKDSGREALATCQAISGLKERGRVSAYLNARVSLFRQRLWQEADFDRLIGVPADDVPAVLAERGLAALAVGFGGVTSLSLEARIIDALLRETRILVRPLRDEERRFILYWTERFEISNVKTLIRAKMAGERPAAVADRLIDMGPFARLDLDTLSHVEDVGELLRRLESTPYGSLVRNARRAFEQEDDPFILDATLDRSYFEALVRAAKPVRDAAGAGFFRLMRGLIDRVNLVWLLRYRFNYGLPPAQVYYLLVASPFGMMPDTLRHLVTCADLASVLAALPPRLAKRLNDCTDIMQVFTRLERDLVADARALLRTGGHALTRAFAYLIVREYDLRSVRTVLRGRHLGLALAAIQQALGRSPVLAGAS